MTTNTTATATTKKITKREKFEMLMKISEVKENPILIEFVQREIELLEKKNSSEKKPTANQVANDGIKEAIAETLADGKMMTITEMQKASAELGELSNQKISALIRQMIMDGLVVKVEDKRKAYFKMV